MKFTPRHLLLTLAMLLLGSSPAAIAQSQTDAPAQEASGMVTLNFPETLELKVLIDYVGKRAGVNFIYDQQTIQRRITINAPQPIPASSLMTLLESVLRTNNLILIETDIPGTLRIEPSSRSLPSVSVLPEGTTPRPSQAVTRVFSLDHISPTAVVTIITPFLSSPQANLTPLPEARLLIVTELGSNLERIEQLIRLIDLPQRSVEVRSVTVNHAKAADLAARANQLLAIRTAPGSDPGARRRLMLQADARTNQIDIVGELEDVEKAIELLADLDQPANTVSRVYRFSNIGPDRIDKLITELIDEVARQSYRAVSDTESNALIVTASPETHEQIAKLAAALDIPRAEQQSPIRFYSLQNARADRIIETLRGIQDGASVETISIDGVSSTPTTQPREDFSRIDGPTDAEINNRTTPRETTTSIQPSGIAIADEELGLDKARIIAHEESNTIIVIARPAMHDVYERLIRRLDVRQPQVLLEATVVSLDTTDGFRLGVEILLDGDLGDSSRGLAFSSFGLSDTVDPGNPGLVLEPGVGFNGAIISPNIADIVIRALQSDNRVKVVSRPEILVNNNATGELVSEREEPFSAVNASSTVSTTSFGGFAAAGTTIRVTPQISEGDHIKLQYDIILSSFSEAAEADTSDDVLPPARQTNSLISEAVIPDGYTMIVGGLTRENRSEVVNSLPILGQIPYIKYLFSDRLISTQQSTLFVFIKAVILRDDKFEYLKFVSSEAAARTGVSIGLPESEPIAIY